MRRVFIVTVLLLASCKQDDALQADILEGTESTSAMTKAEARSGSSGGSAGGETAVKSDKKEPVSQVPYPTDVVDRALGKFGDTAQHTEEERKIIAFVEQYLENYKQLPKPHRHLIQRDGALWVVSVMSLEHLRDPGIRGPTLYVYVRRDQKGYVVEKTRIGT